jgi:hypothetical protein
MFSLEANTTLNALAAGLAKEGKRPADAVKLFTAPLQRDADEANRILSNTPFTCPSCGEYCPVEFAKRSA